MTALRGRVLCGTAIALSVVATVLSWTLLATTPGLAWPLVVTMLLFATGPLFTTLGTVIVCRGNGHRIGWLLVGIGTALAVDTVAATAAGAHVAGVDVPFGVWLTWSDDFVWAPLLFGIWLLVLLFPDGRFPDRLSRAVAVACAAVTAALVVLVPFHATQLIDHPTVTSPVPPVPVLTAAARAALPFLQPCVPLMFLLVAACAVVRYRRSGAVARAQIRWLAWYALMLGILIPLRLVLPASTYPVLDVVTSVTWPLLPVVVAVAVLRYRLYDIDRLVSRTVSYLLLTGALVAVYAGVVAGASALLHDGAGSLGVAAATLVAVSVVRPLRRRLQSAVDRRFDRARHDARRAVADYAVALRGDPVRDHERDLLAVVDRAVAPTRAWLWRPPWPGPAGEIPGTARAVATTTGS